jgi:oxygen-independent coproporphyrinogen-3 oxidase
MTEAAVFDADLIRRYDRPGPRYTSYPTAAEFRDSFSAADYHVAALRNRQRNHAAPLSVYVHIPFCTSPCYYCACTRIITRQPAAAEAYLSRLEHEIELQGKLIGGRVIEQLHFGGGTPTFFSMKQLGRVLEALSRHFELSEAESREYSIEVDPRTVHPGTIEELAGLGFNRISFGVQDFNPLVQRAVNRVQSTTDTLELITQARHCGFHSVSVDLIYGLPMQTPLTFGATLDLVAAVRPDRIAAYSYAHLPQQFKAQRQIDEATLPRGEDKLRLLALIVEKLTGAGYVHIGLDHFALPEDELALARERGELHRSFQGYSTRGGLDLLGLGLSAIGHLGDTYSQNTRRLDLYYAALDNDQLPVARGLSLSSDDRLRADVIAGLMCHGRVDIADMEQRHHIRFTEHFQAELDQLRQLADDGLVDILDQEIRVTPRGHFLLRAVARVFDAYLPAIAPVATARYSRVV